MIPQTPLQWVGFVIYLVFEFWLGRTKKTPANSVIELIILAFNKLFKKEKTMNPTNVQALIEALNLVCDLTNIGLQIAADKKVTIADLGLVLAAIEDVPSAVSDAGQIPAELAALSDADVASIVTAVNAKLNVPPGKAQAIVAASLKLLGSADELVQAFKS